MRRVLVVECVGVAVSDALQAVQLLRAKGLSLAPDLVVLAYNLTDSSDFSGEPEVSPIPSVARITVPPLPAPWDLIEEAYRHPAHDRRRRAALLDLKGAGAEHRVPMVVALIPAFVDRRPYPFVDLQAALLADMQRMGLRTVDLTPVLENDSVFDLSYDSLHPTAAGHAKLAALLAEALRPKLSR